MSAPRRYHLALLAYPRAYRVERAPELLATLAEGDEERGHPSMREAAALLRRGVAMRAEMLSRPDWLLAAAAGLVLLTLLGGFTWAERRFLFRGDVAAWATDGPGVWWALALGVAAFVAIAALFFRAAESARRRRIAALLAGPLALVVFAAPGRVFYDGFPSPDTILDHVVWTAQVIYLNETITVPTTLAAIAATWVALRILGRLAPGTRRRALSVCLVLPAAVAIAQSWLRPDLETDTPRSFTEGYAQSAFADLGSATLLASLALVLALAALWPDRGLRSHPVPPYSR
jgi:hypothetical protein